MNTSNNNKEQKQINIQLAIEEYINSSEENKSLTKISNKYGVKRQTLSKKLKELGYEIINYQNKVRLNETLFDVIDTEEKAYWLGFLYADGYVDSTGNRIEVRLALKDISHLEKFRKFLNLTTEIRIGQCKDGTEHIHDFCHLSFRNKHMWEALQKVGCNPIKSLNLEFPKESYFSEIKLVVHFIRGYIDGDGCLSIYPSSNKSLNTSLSIVGSENFLKSLNIICNNDGYLRNKSTKNYSNKAYSLSFSNVSSRRIARKLYQNATVYLDRKYNKYLEFCRLEEESSRRRSSKIGEGCDANTEVSSLITKG